MKLFIPRYVLAAILTVTCFSFLASCKKAPGEKLVWSDEFDKDGMPDDAKWKYDVGGNGFGNNELQYYTDHKKENAFVKDGHLVIRAIKENFEGNTYTSAKLWTKGIASWDHGKIEVKAKLPAAKGTWPAIWMLPDVPQLHWPDDGEIDIMEHVGYDPGIIHGTVHTKSYNHVINTQKSGQYTEPNATSGFHIYTIEWDQQQIDWFVDNNHYFTFQNEGKGKDTWPFDVKFYLILNLAVGGNWGGKMGVDSTAFPQQMEVDYVRIYQ